MKHSSISFRRFAARHAGWLAVFASLFLARAHAAETCAELKGTWKQTHLSLVLDENVVSDTTASWTFGSDGMVAYKSEFGTMKFKFECRDGVIHMHAPIPSTMKIVRNQSGKMVWAPSMGGFIYVAR